jgi:hypothetical protein
MPRAGAPSVHPVDPAGVRIDRLEACVRALDPGSRALLDLSVRRRLRDDDMAPVLRIDPFNLAWRRARAIEHLATQLQLDDPAGIAAVRAALPRVGDHAWGVPLAIEANQPARPEPQPEQPAKAVLQQTRAALAPRTPPAILPVRHLPPQPPDRLRAAVSAARTAAAARPETVRAAARGALLAGAGALVSRMFSRRRRRRRF